MEHKKHRFTTLEASLGIIASLIAIYAFVTGNQSLQQAMLQKEDEHLPSPVPVATNTPVPSLALTTGGLTWRASDENGNHDLSFSFERQAISSGPSIPPDIILSYRDQFILITASKFWLLDKTPLDSIYDVDGIEEGCGAFGPFTTRNSCPLDIGYSYVVETYSGHLAKFRIQNILKAPIEDHYPYWTADIILEWVYQPNNQYDFR